MVAAVVVFTAMKIDLDGANLLPLELDPNIPATTSPFTMFLHWDEGRVGIDSWSC